MLNMSDMFADVLKKMVPPEVMAMLTPEKISEFGERLNAVVSDIRDRMDRIEAKQNDILVAIEGIKNERDSSNDSDGADSKPRARRRSNGASHVGE